ncbi:hypothetical protein COM55_06225 [Bacillus pseudomycoides]|uniref:HGGxSTG domain-containing protein n=1 Tax=Bacillus pseudomycoides TaxID=64104 RepID=UPI000BF04DFA|nr:HGGxSTG domain-containing protein [Bacillus pseudomycoides]PEK65567.1 hypothetical protein CN590_18035 [Bacillus pseudomycoides]PGE87370.1 hypothetical protein COM55_06225 [Bacillus pseudomycoides]
MAKKRTQEERARLDSLQEELATSVNNEEALKKFKAKMKKDNLICGSIKGSGKLCVNKPHYKEDGTTNGRCHIHGGKSAGQTTVEGKAKARANLHNKANLVHGIYSEEFKDSLTVEEVNLYNGLMEHFVGNYEVDPFNLTMVDRYIMNTIKQARRDSVNFMNESKAHNDFEMKAIRYIESLGLNNKFKQQQGKGEIQQVNLNQLFDLGEN